MLTGKTIFITGATSGFGLACARLFAANGARIIATGRREDRLEALKNEIGDALLPLTLDMRDNEAVTRAIAALPPAFAQIDILINNAGLALGLSSFEQLPMDSIRQMIETNILGVTYCTHALLPGMIARSAQSGCHIVNLSSIAGSYPYPGGNVYGATKAFLTQFSLNLRADLLGKNIRVTSIEPGMAETEFSVVRFGGDAGQAGKVYNGIQALTAEDIANSIYWCITQPEHININRLEIMPTQQAFSPFAVHRA
jgi:3-hydroxy acid dehydrogenase/malonic semialdehyde reductase